MSEGKVFVDTNILIYAYDTSAGTKHTTAQKLMSDLWKERSGVISTQVLQEFYVNVTRKIPRPLDRLSARTIVEDLCNWDVVIIETDTLLAAIDLQQLYALSFWDSMILSAAVIAGAGVIMTEDLNHGQVMADIRICNPFVSHL
jgi:predicted nucleic acid-binding protein